MKHEQLKFGLDVDTFSVQRGQGISMNRVKGGHARKMSTLSFDHRPGSVNACGK